MRRVELDLIISSWIKLFRVELVEWRPVELGLIVSSPIG
ncbi:unnamed protein product, partial [Onchocerca ochengi]|uniref:Uncharacterized protein n=1 Tax=Onchocerca ochengi TaxID=42157 RepID=A0A182EWG9_ONCOC